MSDTAPLTTEKPMTSKDDVIAFLQENPEFLQENPDALEALLPAKKRPRKGEIADFQSYMIERLKTDKAQAVKTSREIVETSRANMNNQQRIHAAVLRLLESKSFNDFIQAITMDMSSILDVDITTFVVESDDQNIPHIQTQGIRMLPQGTVDKWMGDKSVILEDNISGHETIYGGGATLVRSQILLRLNISQDDADHAPPAILAFGSREPTMFAEGQATDQILFLAGVIERCFAMWLGAIT